MTHYSLTRINGVVIGQVLCVYMSYICSLWEMFVLVSQLLTALTLSIFADRLHTVLWARGHGEKGKTYLTPPVGLPTGASSRPAGFLCAWPRQMAAVLLFYFGLVLINTGNVPLLDPPATTHRTLKRGGERSGDGCCVETKVGHVSKVLLEIITLSQPIAYESSP